LGETVDKVTRCVACCDIGGTKVLLGLVDEEGHILVRDRYLLGDYREPGQMVDELIARLHVLVAHAGLTWEAIAGVGCSAAIMADIESGIILSAPNMLGPHRNVPFRDLLERAADCPALIEMDAYASALGEAWKGVGAGVDYFVYIVVGTGVGAGILMEGRVFRGWRGTAGEFGHMTIYPDGPLCNCGRYGCLEALAAGPAIAQRARGAIRQGRRSAMQDLVGAGEITAAVVFDAARLGDDVAQEVVHRTAEFLAIGLSNVIHLLNPRVIGLGGGVIIGGADLLLDPLRQEVARRCGSWVDVEGTHIVIATLGEDAGLLGVARLVWDRVKQ
jgi:glucokinase